MESARKFVEQFFAPQSRMGEDVSSAIIHRDAAIRAEARALPRAMVDELLNLGASSQPDETENACVKAILEGYGYTVKEATP